MQESLRARTVLVTGASSGIGRAIAEAFAGEGCRIALCALPTEEEMLKNVTMGITERAEAVITIPADLTCDEDLYNVVPQVRSRFGDVEILINNAGMFMEAATAETSVEQFDRCMRLNLRAPFVLSKQVIPGMVARRWGRIVNIGSSSAYQGFAGTSSYCASKHGLLGLSRAMHEELKGANIRVHIVSPTNTDTPLHKAFFPNGDPSTLIAPQEIAEAVLFLARSSGQGVIQEMRFSRIRT